MEIAAVASGMSGLDLEDEAVDSGVRSSAFTMARVTKMRSDHDEARASQRACNSLRSSAEYRSPNAN